MRRRLRDVPGRSCLAAFLGRFIHGSRLFALALLALQTAQNALKSGEYLTSSSVSPIIRAMLLSQAQAARQAGVSRQAVALAIKRRDLAAVTIGNRPLVEDDDLEDWMQSPRFRCGGGRKPATAANQSFGLGFAKSVTKQTGRRLK